MNEFIKYVNEKLVGYKVVIESDFDGTWHINIVDNKQYNVIHIETDDMEYAFAKAYVELKDHLLKENHGYLY